MGKSYRCNPAASIEAMRQILGVACMPLQYAKKWIGQ